MRRGRGTDFPKIAQLDRRKGQEVLIWTVGGQDILIFPDLVPGRDSSTLIQSWTFPLKILCVETHL